MFPELALLFAFENMLHGKGRCSAEKNLSFMRTGTESQNTSISDTQSWKDTLWLGDGNNSAQWNHQDEFVDDGNKNICTGEMKHGDWSLGPWEKMEISDWSLGIS